MSAAAELTFEHIIGTQQVDIVVLRRRVAELEGLVEQMAATAQAHDADHAVPPEAPVPEAEATVPAVESAADAQPPARRTTAEISGSAGPIQGGNG